MKIVLVSAVALIDSDGRVLLAQRPEGKSMAGLWEFPGGKVEAGESPEAALIRELKEELGIDFLLYGLLAEIFGRETGFNKGMGGSMHVFFTPFGVYPNNALVGGSADIATGSALFKKVQQAGGMMEEIVVGIRRVSDVIGEISAANHEQRSGIGQVNTSVSELDGMTQQNAALVEQSAAAAESLRDQAGQLGRVIASFRLSTA